MKAKSIVLTVLSVIFIGLLSFGIIWTINNFDKIKLAFSGTSLYTKEDVDAAYQDGYDTAVTDKQDLLTQITSLRAQLDERNNTINVLNKKLANYNALSTEAASLRAKVTELEKEVSDLEKTIASYEEFLQDVESSNKIIATFMLDGAVYKLQAYNSGDIVSIQDPENTDEITFNGWTVNGEFVELSTYTITENTTFVADITYISVTIKFIVDGEVYETKTVSKNSTVSVTNPSKTDYIFLGWSIDGKNVIAVTTDNLVYTALFTPDKPTKITIDGETVRSLSLKKQSSYTYNVAATNDAGIIADDYKSVTVSLKGVGSMILSTCECYSSGKTDWYDSYNNQVNLNDLLNNFININYTDGTLTINTLKAIEDYYESVQKIDRGDTLYYKGKFRSFVSDCYFVITLSQPDTGIQTEIRIDITD